MEQKLKILAEWDSGAKVSDLSCQYISQSSDVIQMA